MKIIEWTEEQQRDWNDWISGRPQIIKDLASKFPPDRLEGAI